MRVWEQLLDTIFPRHCLSCKERITERGSTWVCSQCWAQIPLIRPPYCVCCGLPFPSPIATLYSPEHRCTVCRKQPPLFLTARAVGRYEGVLREIIHAFKYQKRLRLSSLLATLMHQHWPEGFAENGFDYLVPIPLHPRRLREREFNQAQVLAEGLGRLRNIPVLSFVLEKYRWTRSQVELSGHERRKNIEGTFRLRTAQGIQEKRILLIDDVYTTGATVMEAAKVLKDGGASQVAVYTLARVVDR